MRRFLLRLYPAAWLARYGDEFEALLEERSLSPFDVADVVLSAIDAHVHQRGDPTAGHRKGLTMSRHVGGTAAVIAGGLWLVGLALTKLAGSDGILMMFIGMVVLLLALAGLSSFPSRRHPILTWAAFGIPAAGIVAFCLGGIGGVIFTDHPLYNPVFGTMVLIGLVTTIAGSALFAALAYGTGALPRPAIGLLGLGAGLPVVSIALFAIPLPALWTAAKLFGEIGYVAFPLGWIAVGWSATRLDRRIPTDGTSDQASSKMSLRAGGAAAVLGGSLWIAGLVLNLRSGLYGTEWIAAGMAALVVALAGLSSLWSQRHQILTWAAFSVPAFGMVLSSAGSRSVNYFVQPFDDWVGFAQILGSVALYGGTVLFAGLIYRRGFLLRRAPLLLAIGSCLALGGLASFYVADVAAGRSLIYAVGFFLVPLAWIDLGWSAMRLGRGAATVASPAAA